MYCLLLSFTWLIKIVPGNSKKKPKDCPYPILLISDLITIPDIDNDQEEDMVYWPHAGEEKEWAAADSRSGHCLIFFQFAFRKEKICLLGKSMPSHQGECYSLSQLPGLGPSTLPWVLLLELQRWHQVYPPRSRGPSTGCFPDSSRTKFKST